MDLWGSRKMAVETNQTSSSLTKCAKTAMEPLAKEKQIVKRSRTRRESKRETKLPPDSARSELATNYATSVAWQVVQKKSRGRTRKPRPTRPDIVGVRAKEGFSYADILRRLKRDPDLK